ncbi:DUF2975 domain-containing protein [Paeniglutamicibacter sp. ABSL32-1]|uniref:DUF2975 domain-containing protein n=1 Tax=Paeniglutamicibacter quisquiliarum TaxID=2849498 RepID=UPI001C2DD884|nr:DUF2975 domain-containing protein [Paeniglutamicibacter quisquiliarum]MBV1777851.1 DUF2975 domain-containing protein [Paeniglutamicibacter quisquiliarum]
MGKLTVLALRIVLTLGLAGSLFVQVVMVPLLAIDLNEAGPDVIAVRTPLIVIVLLGIVTVQVSMVCVWRLLSMVRRGTVFSHGAFRYVDIVVGAVGAAALLTFAMAVVLAPGEPVAPGIVLLLCGGALLVGGVALIVIVLRMLLAQALDMRAELDEVI